ncbi:brain-specific angiogenesis inhibitor 1-associated protein 2-like protein 1 [Piliocolobus tephrosceles]|uniref:brain-specific angiogenesis inhibitor 1-associated protein 2-like protein 1 n=1 Tax=Piliocolobus tephrosceles TaxID=591936 RepID=UPI000E6B3C65|nr:brain-specific angiogenesis inhibitor 1-associated protein 2-like protein 1 [Piliocolobus tephrosceles]
MSRGPEEVNRLTESTYRNVMEQFNPGLRNLINLGKNYEKAVNAMILAGKAYYDGVAKIGEIATGSPVSTELGHVLIEISSTHKKLNESLDENFKKFHKEIIHELEKKIELDVKYMNATLKRYQTEHKNKLESLEKSQAELKKIRRKSQGGRNALKYEHKEIEYVETVTSRQSEIQKFIADGCKEALLEEKRRFCFLVDKHCGFTNHIHYYHLQSAELLNSKLPRWQETCVDAIKVPEKIMNMIEEIKTPASTPVSGTPQPSPMIERSNVVRKDYDTLSKCSPKMPPAPSGRAYTSPLIDMFNNPATAALSSQKINNSTEKPERATAGHHKGVPQLCSPGISASQLPPKPPHVLLPATRVSCRDTNKECERLETAGSETGARCFPAGLPPRVLWGCLSELVGSPVSLVTRPVVLSQGSAYGPVHVERCLGAAGVHQGWHETPVPAVGLGFRLVRGFQRPGGHGPGGVAVRQRLPCVSLSLHRAFGPGPERQGPAVCGLRPHCSSRLNPAPRPGQGADPWRQPCYWMGRGQRRGWEGPRRTFPAHMAPLASVRGTGRSAMAPPCHVHPCCARHGLWEDQMVAPGAPD